MVEHLESELGVQIQHVAIHKMKYSFQIWSAMMSSKDSDGQVCQRHGLKVLGKSWLVGTSRGELEASQRRCSLCSVPPSSFHLLPKPHHPFPFAFP